MNALNATPAKTLPEYWERATTLPHQCTTLYPPDRSPVRGLSPVERATVRVVAPEVENIPEGASLLHEATFRIALFQQRGLLASMSGHRLAVLFQSVMYPEITGRHARRGWELLRALDASDLVQIWLAAEPLPGQRKRRRMRMGDRITELEK
jgi:hypothetical protein